MKTLRMALAALALLGVGGLAYVAQQARPAGADMVDAAGQFLTSLKDDQKAKATFPFDSKERLNWHFIPLEANGKSTRKGLSLEEMTPRQKQAALGLLHAGTSKLGATTAETIMSLEAILKSQEKKGPTRNPGWYFFTVFGTPSKTGSWGWRVEGHHLSLNFTLEGTQVVTATPQFFGANPAEIKTGDAKGKRILADSEDAARALFKALTDEQKKTAYHTKAFPEPKARSVTPDVGAPVGLPAAKMTAEQRGLLHKLLKSYIGRMTPDVAAVEMKRAEDAGLGKVHFAYNGSTMLGEPHTYRVQGPTFVVEFLNVQSDAAGNRANHIHSSWRRIEGDFGLKR